MKMLIIMWVLTLSDLSSEKKIYEGSLDECLLTALAFNQVYEGKRYAGCYSEIKQYDFVQRN